MFSLPDVGISSRPALVAFAGFADREEGCLPFSRAIEFNFPGGIWMEKCLSSDFDQTWG